MSKEKDDDKDIILFKLITLGDSGVGKTSILKRFVNGKFDMKTISTIGFGTSIKDMTLKNGTKIRLKLIDTAGQENYQALATTYIKNADGVFFVFAHDNRVSFENIKKWLDNFRDNNHSIDFNKDFPAYLVGNKCDLEHKRQVSNENGKELASKYGIQFLETSAKETVNIEKLFEDATKSFLSKQVSTGSIKPKKPTDGINLDNNTNKSSGCC